MQTTEAMRDWFVHQYVSMDQEVDHIEDPLMQKIRWLDKLVDKLAKGKPMDKMLR